MIGKILVKFYNCAKNYETSDESSALGDEGETPDSGRRDDRLPPPITSMAPAILRAGGGPAFFTITDPAYLEFSFTTEMGIGREEFVATIMTYK